MPRKNRTHYLVAVDPASCSARIWKSNLAGVWPTDALAAQDFPTTYAKTLREARAQAAERTAHCRNVAHQHRVQRVFGVSESVAVAAIHGKRED